MLVAVNAKKEDELLRLEGERIDKRSLLEKALLQGSRRNQRPHAEAAGALESSQEIDELKVSLAVAERAVKVTWGVLCLSCIYFVSPLHLTSISLQPPAHIYTHTHTRSPLSPLPSPRPRA